MATVVAEIPLSTWRDSWEMGPEGGGLEGLSGADVATGGLDKWGGRWIGNQTEELSAPTAMKEPETVW